MEGNARYLIVLTILVLAVIMQASSGSTSKKAIKNIKKLTLEVEDHWNNSRQADMEALFTDDMEIYLDNVPLKHGKSFLHVLTQLYPKVRIEVREIKSLVGNTLFMLVTNIMLVDENETDMLLNDATGITLVKEINGKFKIIVFIINSLNKTPATIARQVGISGISPN